MGKKAVAGLCAVAGLVIPAISDALESPLSVGYFCGPDSQTIVDGQYYLPQADACTYLSHALSFGPRVGDLYRGTVGSSTLVTGHGIGAFGATSTQFGDLVSAQAQGVHQGEDMFVAMYRDFNGSQFNTFRNFFRTGAGTLPHSDYGFIRFKWGTEPPDEPDDPDPVIIIPGILGSEKNSNGEWVIDPILHTYDDLIATLDVNHYTPGVDLFTFPYNWRKSNIETALLLKEKIDEVKEICQCDKVDLVAHSMGGLVARQYIQSDAYEQDVDQLIFLGTPHLGAPKAYLMWEGGELSSANDLFEEFSEKFLEHEAYEKGYPSLFAYIHTESIDSIRELLPTYDYIFDRVQLRSYPSNYPQNLFLEKLNMDADSLLNSGVEIYNIIGNTNIAETITAIQVVDTQAYIPLWEHGYPDGFYDFFGNHGLIRGTGDKTVPIPSASFINKNLTSISSVHQSLPDSASADVYQTLVGATTTDVVDNWNFPNLKIILFQIFSPADLLVIAPDGKKVGKKNGQSVNEITSAFYTGFNTDTEFITILNPLDGEYKVITEGTGNGEFTIETNYISEATTTTASFTGNTIPGLTTEFVVPISNESPQEIEIQPSDTEPPVISINAPDKEVYLRSEILPIEVSAEDPGSGLYFLETKLDDIVVPNVGSMDLFFQSLGNHALITEAKDNVNNTSTASKTFKVIANATSTRDDMSRALSLSWMTKKIYDDLTKKFDACFKKKTTVTSVTKTIVITGKNGKPATKKVTEKVTKVEIYFDKKTAQDILKTLDKYRGKGLNEQGYQLLKEDIQWLINN